MNLIVFFALIILFSCGFCQGISDADINNFVKKLRDDELIYLFLMANRSIKGNAIKNYPEPSPYTSPLEPYPTEHGAADSNLIIEIPLEAKYKQQITPPKKNCYKIGNILRVTCDKKESNNVTWIVTDNNKKYQFEKIPPCFRQTCIIEMQLELFDDGAHIICTRDNLVSQSLVLKLDDTRPRLQQTSTEEIRYYSENEQLQFECQVKSAGHLITNITSEGKVTYNQIFFSFKLTEKQTGSRFFCTHYINTDGTVFKTTRKIDSYKLYLSNESGKAKITKWILFLAAVIGICILLAVVVVLLLKYKKRTVKPAHEVDTYACVNRVEYAELDMLQTNSRRNNIKVDDRSPYAEVIGVLTPKK